MNKEIVATFPHMANYYVAIKLFLEKGINIKCIIPPPITKKTLELGSKYSPDFVCSPFKYNLGNFIEALDSGANLLIQSGGFCRYGQYGELQEQILKDLGYDFTFIFLPLHDLKEMLGAFKVFKKLGIKLNIFKCLYFVLLTIMMIKKIDIYEDFKRCNIGFEVNEGEFDRNHKVFLRRLKSVKKISILRKVFKEEFNKLKAIPVNKPSNLLKVGIVGELYSVMDEFSNHYLEKELAKKGVEIKRFISIDYLIFKSSQSEKKLLKKKSKFIKHHIGAGGLDSVIKSEFFACEKYDGIIHIKAFGCTPEVNAMPILQNVAADYKIPILYFSFDTATSETGIKTRIEAFYDMLVMRRDK